MKITQTVWSIQRAKINQREN